MNLKNVNDVDVFAALRKIIIAVTGCEIVVEADQSVHAPAGEYATIRVMQTLSDSARGDVRKVYNQTDETMTESIYYPAIFECTVNFWRGNAVDRAYKLLNCSRLATVHSTLLTNGLGWIGAGPVNNITELQFDRSEKRAVVTVRLTGFVKLSETVNTIQSVTVGVEDEKKNVLQSTYIESVSVSTEG